MERNRNNKIKKRERRGIEEEKRKIKYTDVHLPCESLSTVDWEIFVVKIFSLLK